MTSSSSSSDQTMSNKKNSQAQNSASNTNALRSTPIIASAASNVSARSSTNNIVPSTSLPRISSIPSMPSIPMMNTAGGVLPIQMNGVQYIVHPSTATSAAANNAVPVIVVPNMNLMNTANTNTAAASASNPSQKYNEKIKQILEKKRKGKEPLNEQEIKILEAAVQSARQQFLCWYQQQALRQSLLLNHNLMSAPNPSAIQQAIAQPLSAKQIALLQQRQLIQQQQQILQTQLAATQMSNNNIAWLNNNNRVSNGSLHNQAFNPYAAAVSNGNSMNLNNNTNRFNINSNYNANTYNNNNNHNNNNNAKCTDYFALPKATEFDKIFYKHGKQQRNDDDDDDTISVFGVADDDNDDILCFDMELEGLGTFHFGEQHHSKSVRASFATETSSKKRGDLYKSLGIKDITNECCQWLVRDLMRSQSELKSDSAAQYEERHVTMTQLKHINTDVIPKQHMDRILAQIKRSPTIPHSALYNKIYDVYCRNNSFIEISHVDISSAHIQLHENKAEADVNHNDVAYDKEKMMSDLKDTTLEFYTLCMIMQQHFNPSNDVETLHVENLSNDDVFYKTAQKLRENPNYFKMPTLFSSAAPVDRQLFGTKLENKKHHNHKKNTVPVPPQTNVKNVTNNVFNIGNITINNTGVPSAISTPWQNITIPTYNPLPAAVNPLTLNHAAAPTLIQSPLIYNLPNPYVAPQTITIPNAYPAPPQVPLIQSPTKQIKIPWNVGRLK